MQNQFTQFIQQYHLFEPQHRLLVAVSGGVDSMVLLHLLSQSGYEIAVAHCNFKLRGEESDSDEAFVKNNCEQKQLQSHFIAFDTEEYANKHKLSIEMAARELRYNWFNELMNDFSYDFLVTGHHLNDSIETLFLNLSRGTGYSGMTGIAPKNDRLVRPLLFATRDDIEAFAKKNKLTFCVDASNDANKYQRNLIRNKIIPLFRQLNPGFEQVMQKNLKNLNEAATILDNYFDGYREKSYSGNTFPLSIPFYKITGKKPINIHLFQLIGQFGFNRDAVARIIKAMDNHPGRMFFSEKYRLLIDRDALIISEKADNTALEFELTSFEELKDLPVTINHELQPIDNFELRTESNFACLDAAMVEFPVIVRKWKAGDYFYPLGMKKRKKISDFLIDSKINRLDKENTWIMESQNGIFWIIGHRIDNRFKITKTTKDVIVLHVS